MKMNAMGERLAETGRMLVYIAGLVLLIGAASHALAWILTRRGTVRWVWRAGNVLGAMFLGFGVVAITYAWAGLGLHTGPGGLVAGLALLLASAGLWMLVPI